MKKLLSLLLAGVMALSLVACGGAGSTDDDTKKVENSNEDVKIGVILIGDENEGYTYSHIKGIQDAAAACGIEDDQIIWAYSIPEDETCYDKAIDLADQGCQYVISNSYGHQSYMQQAAEEEPDVTFISATGDTAKNSGLENFKNAFTNIYEARYVSGVVAGLKIAELDAAGEIPAASKTDDGKVKVGYVGAYPYAEVVSGYTAFFLGIRSVYENVVMDVQYTNSWFDITGEGEAANALMANGCLIIGQHADSTGAPSAVQAAHEKGTTAFCVGYNVDMLSVAPDVALTSPTNVWSVYYEHAFNCLLNGEELETDFAAGYNDNGVTITDLGTACAEGTAEKVEEVIAGIKDGSVKVFDLSTFTVDGEEVDSFYADLDGDFAPDEGVETSQAVNDGAIEESTLRSAPYFTLRIDGITELNAN